MNTSPETYISAILLVLWMQFGDIKSQCLSGADACFPPVPCEQLERVSNPSDCTSYQICLAPYEWVIDASDCGGGSSYFSNSSCTCRTSNVCVDPWECPVGTSTPPRASAPCFLEPTECTSTSYVPDAYYCSKYFECETGSQEWVSATCPPGEYFDDTLIFLPQPCRADIGACERIAFDQCFPYTGPTTTSKAAPPTTVPSTTEPTTTVPPTTEPTTAVPPPTVPTTAVPPITKQSTTIPPTTESTTTVPPPTQPPTVVPTSNKPTSTVSTTTMQSMTTISGPPKATTDFISDSTNVPSSATSTEYMSTTTHPFSADACEPLYACSGGEKVAHKSDCNLFYECADGSWEEKNCEAIDSSTPYYNPDRGTCQIEFWVDCDVRCHTDGIRINKMTRNIAIIATMCGIVIIAIVLIAVLCTLGTRDGYDSSNKNAYSLSGVADIPRYSRSTTMLLDYRLSPSAGDYGDIPDMLKNHTIHGMH